MLDIRSPLIALAAPAGLSVAGLLWLMAAGHSHAAIQLDQLNARLSALHAESGPVGDAYDDIIARGLAAPLFALTTGQGAVPEPVIRLTGVAITPERKAALLSINNKPADWLEKGATRDGVTVISISPGKVSLDTATGFKDVGLWDKSGPDALAAEAVKTAPDRSIPPNPAGLAISSRPK